MQRHAPIFGAVLAFGVAAGSAFAQSASRTETSGWKVYRNEAMGFETSYPATWHVRQVKGTGIESVTLDETPRVGKSHLAVQFWVQRAANPQGLSIEQWHAAQLRRMKAPALPTIRTSLGGRPAIRMEAAGSLGRTFQFFTSLNTTDVFTVTVSQPASQTQFDRTYQELLSTLRFIR